MIQKKSTRMILLVIALLAITSIACGLFNRLLETVVDRGLDALGETEMLEEVFSAMEMMDESRLDLTPYEAPEAAYLFEIDPFEDVIRWRFYAIFADPGDIGEYYLDQLPDAVVEQDQVVNGQPHLVLTAGHPLSGIYTRDQLDGMPTGYEMMESMLLDVEVLHSTAHEGSGRLGISSAMGLLPSPLPEDVTLVILVYNLSQSGIGGIIDGLPGGRPDGDQDGVLPDPGEGLDDADADPEDRRRDQDEVLVEFMEDDETQEIEDLSGTCDQVLGSGPCYHPYIPVVEGYTRSYQTGDGITTETVTDVRSDGFTVVMETADGHTISTDFDCKEEGVAGWDFYESIMETLEDAPAGLDFDIEIEGVLLPADLSQGDTWPLNVSATVSMQAPGVVSKNVIEMELTYTAAGEETITTSAGRFRAMRVDYVSTGENILVVEGPAGTHTQPIFTLSGSGSDWYAECLGKVRSEAHSRWTGVATFESVVRMDLTDFGIQ